MIDFQYPTLQDKFWVSNILKNCSYYSSDCCFGTIYMWADAYKIKISRHKGFLLRFYESKEPYYGFPLGNGDLNGAIDLLSKDAKKRNIKFKLLVSNDDMKELIVNHVFLKFDYNSNRDIFDYIYSVSDLSKLNGKKYHSKRNHISKFNSLYNWEYKDINSSNINQCKLFIQKWFNNNILQKGMDMEKEYHAIFKALDSFNELNLLGGIIKVESNIVALTIGEEINKNVFLIHFEKADYNYIGSYTIINKEFALKHLQSYKYINREEDMGIEGLRKSKLSYHPIELLSKYEAIARE